MSEFLEIFAGVFIGQLIVNAVSHALSRMGRSNSRYVELERVSWKENE